MIRGCSVYGYISESQIKPEGFQDVRIQKVTFQAVSCCETRKENRQLLSKVGEQKQTVYVVGGVFTGI